MGEIVLDNVSKTYGKGHVAVTDLSLGVADGEFLVMVGPSGCGKTTALRMVAGLEEVTSGTIAIDGKVVNHVKPKDRDIAMVFQDYALYPQMTVYQNMAFGLKVRKMPKAEIERTVREVAGILGLEKTLDRRPGHLSGGQRQRVAMGRAITRHPAAFLMDEPLSNLDAKLRVQMRAEIARIQNELGVTTLYVTHDQVEAVTLGDRVAVLRDGLLQQVAPPKELYDTPRSIFVASFIGSPTMNLMYSNVDMEGGDAWVVLGKDRVRLNQSVVKRRPQLRGLGGQQVVVGVRPEDLLDTSVEPSWPQDQRLRAEASLVEDLGAERLVHFDLDVRNATDVAADPDAKDLQLDDRRTHCVAKFGRMSRTATGEMIEIAIDTERLHFFDAVTGMALAGKPLLDRAGE
jgi:multiple sugar transport system ATP-binding protein